jgi:uncharacterized protein (UPF0305 family)
MAGISERANDANLRIKPIHPPGVSRPGISMVVRGETVSFERW